MPTHTFMELALDEAHAAADAGEVPIGCVIVCDGDRHLDRHLAGVGGRVRLVEREFHESVRRHLGVGIGNQ